MPAVAVYADQSGHPEGGSGIARYDVTGPVHAQVDAGEADGPHQQGRENPDQNASWKVANARRQQAGEHHVKAEGTQGVSAGKAVAARIGDEEGHRARAVKQILQGDIQADSADRGGGQPNGGVAPANVEEDADEDHEQGAQEHGRADIAERLHGPGQVRIGITMDDNANVQVKVRELALKYLARQPGEEQKGENRDSKAAQQQSPQSGACLLEGGFGPGGIVRQDAGKYSGRQVQA